MGKIVDLCGRRAGQREPEALLDRVTRYYRDRLQAREALPSALAALLRAGQSEAVLQAIVAWGEEGVDPVDLLAHCRRLLSP